MSERPVPAGQCCLSQETQKPDWKLRGVAKKKKEAKNPTNPGLASSTPAIRQIVLDRYLQEIGKRFRLITPDEEVRLAERNQAG